MQKTKTSRRANLAWAAAFGASGLTAQGYATAAGCSVGKLYYWLGQLDTKQEDTASFAAITIGPEVAGGGLHLCLPDGIEVHGPLRQLVAFVHQLREHA